LIADVFPFLPPGSAAQQVQVGCGKSVLAEWAIARPMLAEAEIPVALRSGTGESILWWRLPGAASPVSVGISNDARVLALAFRRIAFHPLGGSR
jgi:hypothetical protein